MNIFETIKGIPFPRVQDKFHGAEPKRGKVLCPFHQEKTPSFHVYDDGWKCWGCGEYGDSVDFVSKYYNLRPIEAARLIAKEFNLPVDGTGEIKADISPEIIQAKREREFKKVYKRQEGRRFIRLMLLIENTKAVFNEKGFDVSPELQELIHNIPLFEFWADILAEGSEKERVALFKDVDFRRWTG